jgi:flagellar basal body rod protein FlgC
MASVSSIAQSGISAAMLRLDGAAHRIAHASTEGALDSSQLAGDLVEQMVALYAFKANLGVIETERAMLGSLLDLRA